jgi:hypothetical protein
MTYQEKLNNCPGMLGGSNLFHGRKMMGSRARMMVKCRFVGIPGASGIGLSYMSKFLTAALYMLAPIGS